MEIDRMAWHSSKFIFLEISSNSVIEGGESENRGPRVWMNVVYVVENVVLENSKIVKKHPNLSNLISNASSRWDKQLSLTTFSDPVLT